MPDEREQFDALVRDNLRPLRAVIRRMVGHPEDTEDLVQEALLRAWNARNSFRAEAAFGTWLCAIGVRAAIDHLRSRKRWRSHAQVAYANACVQDPALGMEVGAVLSAPDFVYEAREHIAFCFTCVGRSLEPEQQAALLLAEVLGLTAREGARALELTESVFRHTLAAARREMEREYEGLCSLVNKQGVCYQCKGLRDGTRADGRGAPPRGIATLAERLSIVRDAEVDSGVSQRLHDLFWRRLEQIESRGDVTTVPLTDCGQ